MNGTTIKFEKITGEFTNGFTGRRNKTATVCKDQDGNYGFLANGTMPYSPIGGRKALNEVFEMGCLIFMPYNFS